MDERIATLAVGQHGVVSRGQLLEAGIPPTTLRDRIERGQLVPLHRGVYAVGHAHLRPNGVTHIEEIPVTTVSRTLVDLAEVLAHQALTKVLGEAERQRVLDVKGIEEAIRRLRGRRGRSVGKVRAALRDLGRHGAIVELDGWAWHNTRRAFQRDRDKANLWTGRGWAVLRFTHDDLVWRPAVVVAGVRDALSRADGSARPPRASGRRAS